MKIKLKEICEECCKSDNNSIFTIKIKLKLIFNKDYKTINIAVAFLPLKSSLNKSLMSIAETLIL